jgi:hypothetical protein
MNIEVVQTIANFALEAEEWWKPRAILLLLKIVERIMRTMNRPEVMPHFAHFISFISVKFSDMLIGTGMLESAADSVAFAVLDRLCLLIVRNLKSIEIDIAAVEQLLALSLLQQMSPSTQEPAAILLDRVFYITLHSILRLSDAEGFVQFEHHDFEPYLTYDCPEDAAEEHRVLANCVNHTRWSSPATVKSFIEAIEGRMPLDELQRRLKVIDRFQPQPLHKIQRYLETDAFDVKGFNRSALSKVIDIVQWIHNIPRISFKLIFTLFTARLRALEDELLCLPKTHMLAFVDRFPGFMSLPPSLIYFSGYQITADFLMKMDTFDLQKGLSVILDCPTPMDPEPMLRPFFKFDASKPGLLRKFLLLAIIGFSKTGKKFTTEPVASLKRFFVLVDPMALSVYIKVVQVLLSRELCPASLIFELLLDLIGAILVKDRAMFSKIDHFFPLFQVCFELVDFCRTLLKENEQFRGFLTEELTSFNRPQTLAVLAIANNSVDVPRKGSSVIASKFDFSTVSELIDTITHRGKKLKLVNSTSLDYRNCAAIKIISSVNFSPEWFSDLQPFLDFFQKYVPEGCVDEFLFLASLQEFLKSDEFRRRFTFWSNCRLPDFEPEIDRSPIQSFLSFYSFFTPENLPKFQLSSICHQSSIRKDWSVIICDKSEIYSSPLPTFLPSCVEFEFAQAVELSIVSVLNYRSISQHFELIHISNDSLTNLQILPPLVVISNGDKRYKIDLLSSSVFVFLKIQSHINQIIKFRLVENYGFEPMDLTSASFVKSAFSPFENNPFPMGSLFTDSFEQLLCGAAKNYFWKSICLQILPEIQLEMPRLIAFVHSVLCDSVPLTEVLNVDIETSPTVLVPLTKLLRGVDKGEFVDQFVAEFERQIGDIERHGVWKTNSVVHQVAPHQMCSRCVVFSETLLVFGATREPVELPALAPALPISQLARSGIELVQFARNAVEVVIALGQPEKLGTIKAIVDKAIEQKSIVFTSPKVRSVDDFVRAQRK